MKQFYFIALTIFCSAFTFKASAQYDKCGPAVPLITLYYSAEKHTKFGGGLEAGTQGIESPLGFFVGFRFQKMSDSYFKKDSASFNLKSSLYLKGAIRLNEPTGRGSIFITGAPELSVQTGFDFKTGLRLMLPLNQRKAIGIESLYSISHRTLSLNILATF